MESGFFWIRAVWREIRLAEERLEVQWCRWYSSSSQHAAMDAMRCDAMRCVAIDAI